MNGVLLDLLAFGAVVSGILVITSNNPVISVLFLISVFLNVAGYLVLLGVAYLGLVYIIVYVGAIAILFLFVIMLLNVRLIELHEAGSKYAQSIPLGVVLVTAFSIELLSILPTKIVGSLGVPYTAFNAINTFFLASFKAPTNVDTVNSSKAVLNTASVAYNPVAPDAFFTTTLQIESIGQGLYTYSTLWLVIASVILLLSMVGPIILCMQPAGSYNPDQGTTYSSPH